MKTERIFSEFKVSLLSFLRKRTTVFFTFFFPLIIIGISAVFIQSGGGGFLTHTHGFYISGYLSVVVLLTPLERMGSEITRYVSLKRFEKLTTTPIKKSEWLVSHILVNMLVVGIESIIIILIVTILDSNFSFSILLIPFILFGVIVFCGIGCFIGSISDSQDSVTAISNAVGLPMLFLSDTFITKQILPPYIQPIIELSPLTYFARGVRASTYPPKYMPWIELFIIIILAILSFIIAIQAIPMKK